MYNIISLFLNDITLFLDRTVSLNNLSQNKRDQNLLNISRKNRIHTTAILQMWRLHEITINPSRN